MISTIRASLSSTVGLGNLQSFRFIDPERFQVFLRKLNKTDFPLAVSDFHFISYGASLTGVGAIGEREFTITVFFLDKPADIMDDDEVAAICDDMNAEAETLAVKLNQDMKTMSNNAEGSGVENFQVQTVRNFSADKLAGCMVTYDVNIQGYFNGVCPS